MSSRQEVPLVEYARYYGLSRNHLEENPLRLVPPPEDFLLQFDEGDGDFLLPDINPYSPPSERLTAVKEAATLLGCLDPKQYEESTFDDIGFSRHSKIRSLKVELPLLRSDHEVDMQSYFRQISPDLEREFFPYEQLDKERDEGLEWPSKYHELPDEFFKKAQSEKLEVSKEILTYISEQLSVGGDDVRNSAETEPKYQRNTTLDPVTPPLLPRSPIIRPFEPSSDTGRLELLSEHSSPTRQELHGLETALFAEDAIVPSTRHKASLHVHSSPKSLNTEDLGNIYSPLKGIDEISLPPPTKRTSLEDSKVEVPLTPRSSVQLPLWKKKSDSISEALKEVIHDLPSPIPNPEDVSSRDIDAFFDQEIAPLAKEAEREIEQEQLQEADTTHRIPIPIMDFSLPKAPWKPDPDKERKSYELLAKLQQVHLGDHKWPIDEKTIRELSWTPFPSSLGQFDLNEILSDDGTLDTLTAEPESIDTDTLIWKPEGLRILDEIQESDEEELQVGQFPEAVDMVSLVKKRNFELQDGKEFASEFKMDRINENNSNTLSSVGRSLESFAPVKKLKSDRGTLALEHTSEESIFSPMSALNTFLCVRKGSQVSRSQKTTPQQCGKLSEVRKEVPTAPDSTDHQGSKDVTSSVAKQLPLPLPHLEIPISPRPFVASTSFLSNRKLARQIQHLYNNAQFIERDFAIRQTSNRRTASAQYPQESDSDTVAYEVDLILSPGTGLLLTTLQQIKQRSLPGQGSQSPVFERIWRTAPRYEKLVIIVHRKVIPDDSESPELDQSDCKALASLTSFLNGSAIGSDHEVVFVDGDNTALATWVVSLMRKYSTSDTNLKMLQEETQWEVFLRQAGMNAFAAQAVLSRIKSMQEQLNRGMGLQAFLLMDAEERNRIFGNLLGGHKVLRNVGKVLDARW